MVGVGRAAATTPTELDALVQAWTNDSTAARDRTVDIIRRAHLVMGPAVVLGAETKAGPNGVEAGFARDVRPTDHPMHAGRRASFDVICMHRDDVTRAPKGAVVTAANDHTGIQAFAYDQGDVSFWGVQYHPEATVKDVGYWFSRATSAEGHENRAKAGRQIARIAEDPVLHADSAARHRVGVDILDRAYHLTEIRNWLDAKVL